MSGICPSWTAISMELHSTWLHADLDHLRHITADISWENNSRHLSQRCCMVVHALRWGVKPISCRWPWRLYPFLLTCWVLEGWRSLAQSHKHAVCTLDTSLFHVSCSKNAPGYLGMMVHMGWIPLRQEMHSTVPRIHMPSYLVGLSPLCWLWQVISVLLWVVGGQVPRTHHGIPLTSDLWDLEPHCDVWLETLLLDSSEHNLW